MHHLALILALLFGLSASAAAADEESDFEAARDAVWVELVTPIRADEVGALAARRQRLNDLFASVPAAFAPEFLDEIGLDDTGGEFSSIFHGELARAVRRDLLAILGEKVAEVPADPDAQASTLPLRGRIPLPSARFSDFLLALGDFEAALPRLDPIQQDRMTCVLDILSDPAVDDRATRWSDICPDEGHALSGVLGGCPIRGFKPDAQRLHDALVGPSDVESEGVRLGALRHLRTELMSWHDLSGGSPSVEITTLFLEGAHDDVMRANKSLSQIAQPGLGGGTSMATRLKAVLDWLGDRRDDDRSVQWCLSR